MAVFNPTSRHEWLEKLKKDLKTENLSEYGWKLDDESSISPFLHAPEADFIKHRASPWKLAIHYPEKFPHADLKKFIKQHNIDAIVFDTDEEFKTSPERFPDEISSLVFLNFPNSDDGFTQEISIMETENYASALADALTRLHRGLGRIKDSGEDEIPPIHLLFRLGNSMYKNMGVLRTWKMLSEKLLTAWELRTNVSTWAYLTKVDSEENPHIQQLDLTWQFISAIVGNADYVVVPVLGDEFSETNLRLPVNISHILEHESYFRKYEDPMAGSYFMEELCNRLALQSWNLFRKKCSH